ncbi:helix-turn-helix domain-containing protein [Marichromatium sp. PS1]|uniref:helix-turn-helix domain-containing protein n=1 Tax=Marichromatium sp. PS1 TaxID=3138932 RepID=UPI0034E89D03
MSETRSPSPEAPSTPDIIMHPGQRLRQQRETRGLEIARVASQLHLRPEIIEALEQDRYDALPGPVFAIGYLRNYARLLGIDPTPLIESARTVTQEQAAAQTGPRTRGNLAETTSRWLMRLISLALMAAAVAMLVLWWQSRPEVAPAPLADDVAPSEQPRLDPAPSQATPAPVAPAPTTPEPRAPQPAPRPTPAPTQQTSALVAAPEPGATPDTISTLPGAAPAPAPAPTVASGIDADRPEAAPTSVETAPTPPEVALEFTGNCWVEVRDVNRRIILTGELRAGDRRVLEGEPPYRFIIGNTAMARLTIDGEPLDLSERARGNVARFTLDPSQPD